MAIHSTSNIANLIQTIRSLKNVEVSLGQLPLRIICSFIPPIFSRNQPKLHADLFGPGIALVILILLLNNGHALKFPQNATEIAPITVVLMYFFIMAILSYILSHLGQSKITFIQMLSLIGYSLFAHILTLFMSHIFYNETSNFLFFCGLLIFGGLSTLRIIIILVTMIPKPALRLIVCSVVSISQLLFLIILNFVYIHRTFMYGVK